MARMSTPALEYAFQDAQADILYLSNLLSAKPTQEMLDAATKADQDNVECLEDPYTVIYMAMMGVALNQTKTGEEIDLPDVPVPQGPIGPDVLK